MPRRKTARKNSPARSASLRRYVEKRRFDETPEPSGQGAASSSRNGKPRLATFVIQKHDATRLHFDLRLEMDGVFKSWAVPKGLPTKPGDRSLAIEVEDHPLSYGGFEGTIPEGNYGAGTVMVWDHGIYTVSGGRPGEALRRGKIHFALLGDKCTGEWTLVRMSGDESGNGKTNWLLIKNQEAHRRAPIKREGRERSVLTDRTMDEIAAAGKQPAKKRRASRAGKKRRTS